jgi:hypothetical protein
MKALSKERDDRYKWAGEMAEDLQRFLFSSNQPFSRTDLQRYMKQHFEAEITEEYARLERYKQVKMEDVEEPANVPVRAGTEITTGETHVGGMIRGNSNPTGLMTQPGFEMDTSATAPAQPYITPLPGGALPPEPKPKIKLSLGVKLAIFGSILVALAGVGVAAFVMGGGLAPDPGLLSLDVSPNDAEIYLNEQLVSTMSPFHRGDVAPGTYVLKVQREGFQPIIRTLRIVSGEHAKETIVLEAEKGQASVMVRTTPEGFDVWFDGEPTGQKTPANITQLMPGKYKLALKRDTQLVHEREIELGSRTVMDVNEDLSRLPPLLVIKSGLVPAEVTINGKKAGNTPLKLDDLAPGSVQVSMKRTGCKKRTEKVALSGGARLEIDWALECP